MKITTVMKWLACYLLMSVIKKVSNNEYVVTSVKTNSEDAEEKMSEEYQPTDAPMDMTEMMDTSNVMTESEFQKYFNPKEGERIYFSNLNSSQVENYLRNLEVGSSVLIMTEDNKSFSLLEK